MVFDLFHATEERKLEVPDAKKINYQNDAADYLYERWSYGCHTQQISRINLAFLGNY